MINLIKGDCLEEMAKLPAASIDLVLTDPPYGTTACKWDTVIDLPAMWAALKNLIKANGAAVLFGNEPFSSALRMSNIKSYKYDWIWKKDRSTGHLNAWKMPMKKTENISVFGTGKIKYYPILKDKPGKDVRPLSMVTKSSSCYGKQVENNKGIRKCPINKSMPDNVLFFTRVQKGQHPTQKPVALIEYLIKTYTNPGDRVLDFTMGSGTTGVACANLGRKFTGIELDKKYFEIAEKRIDKAYENYLLS